METVYLVLVIVLFILAISDLIVGVSNDAVAQKLHHLK
jgi:hypothetical protein